MTTIYKLTRDLSGDHELIGLSTDRKHLADLMRVDIDKWTVPVTYTTEITLDFENFWQEARTHALKQAKIALYKASLGFPYSHIDAFFFRKMARVVENLQP